MTKISTLNLWNSFYQEKKKHASSNICVSKQGLKSKPKAETVRTIISYSKAIKAIKSDANSLFMINMN